MLLQMFIPYENKIDGLGGNSFNGEQLLQYSTFFVLNFQGLITLYIPLILLYKSEGGTLNIKQYQNETDDKIFQKNSTGNSGNPSVDDNNDPQNEEPEIVLPAMKVEEPRVALMRRTRAQC